MKLSKTSWHYKLFSLTYEKDVPNNLCPYFWMLAFSILCFPFNFIWNLPVTLIDKLSRLFGGTDGFIDWDSEKYFGDLFKISLAINFCVCCLIGMVGIWINYKNGYNLTFGTIGYILLVSLLSYFAHEWYKDNFRKIAPTYKKPKPNLIAEFIKAKYNRYCPKIEWTSKDKTTHHEAKHT